MVQHFPRSPFRGTKQDDQAPYQPDRRVGGRAPALRFGKKLRRYVLAAAVTCALVATLGPGLPALAGPEEDKERVERELEEAHEELDGSSKELNRATRKLAEAQAKLKDARAHLSRVRGQLAAAEAEDKAAAKKLADARAAVKRAEDELAEAQRKVEEQRARIVAFANATNRSAGMENVALILGSTSVEDLLTRMQVVDSVSEAQAGALEALNSARAEVAAKKDALEKAEAVAEKRRQEAAKRLAEKRRLEREAVKAEGAVRDLVERREQIHAEAAEARAEALRRYRELEAERKRIEKILKEQARREAEERRRQEERERRKRDGDGGSSSSGGGGSSGGSGGSSGGGSSSSMIYPVSAPVTSSYGMRFHPILRIWKLHDGTDFGAGCGTPIVAAASGRVTSRYYNGGYGNRILVSHGYVNGKSVVTAYNHLSGYAVSTGQWVDRGQVIGYVGTTGYSTGCHLHFMVYENGSTVDPMGWL